MTVQSTILLHCYLFSTVYFTLSLSVTSVFITVHRLLPMTVQRFTLPPLFMSYFTLHTSARVNSSFSTVIYFPTDCSTVKALVFIDIWCSLFESTLAVSSLLSSRMTARNGLLRFVTISMTYCFKTKNTPPLLPV